MKELIGSEEVLTGLAAEITTQIEILETLKTTATMLESGLDTKISIIKAAAVLRKGLYTLRGAVHKTYQKTNTIKLALLENIGDIQKENTKAALLKKIQEDTAKLEAM